MAEPIRLTKADILKLFDLLNADLEAGDTHAEVYLVGGAVMCLALGARAATRDVNAWFKPATLVRQAAARVAARAGVPDNWLNDAVKAWLSPRGEFDRYLERSHLQVFVARPAYLLAMKCAAMRLGEEFHDLDDVRYLLRYLNITTAAEALAIVTQYFDEAQIPPKRGSPWKNCCPDRTAGSTRLLHTGRSVHGSLPHLGVQFGEPVEHHRQPIGLGPRTRWSA